MGEEFGTSAPFPFFADFEPALADAVREGLRAEFSEFPEFRDPHKRDLIPDPTMEQTFQSAKLNWAEATERSHADWLALYRELLAIRQREIIPRLKNIGKYCGSYEILGESAVSVHWIMGDGTCLRLAANLSDQRLTSIKLSGRRLWSSRVDSDNLLDSWGVFWSVEGESGLGREGAQ